MAADEKRMRHALAATAAAKRQLQSKINRLVASQFNQGNIPSQYNGTLRWPMGGVVTQDFGCTGVVFEPPMGNCAHWHNGIDIVAPTGPRSTRRAAAASSTSAGTTPTAPTRPGS